MNFSRSQYIFEQICRLGGKQFTLGNTLVKWQCNESLNTFEEKEKMWRTFKLSFLVPINWLLHSKNAVRGVYVFILCFIMDACLHPCLNRTFFIKKFYGWWINICAPEYLGRIFEGVKYILCGKLLAYFQTMFRNNNAKIAWTVETINHDETHSWYY